MNHLATSEEDTVKLLVQMLSSAEPRCVFVRTPGDSNLIVRLMALVKSKIATEGRGSLYGPRLIKDKNVVFFPTYPDEYYDTRLVTDFVQYELENLKPCKRQLLSSALQAKTGLI